MKKNILITVVCLFITCPVYAQEVNSLLSLNKTMWGINGEPYISFYRLGIYSPSSCNRRPGGLYIDLPGVSFWYYGELFPLGLTFYYGIFFPLIGVGYELMFDLTPNFRITLYEKLSDSWTPEECTN